MSDARWYRSARSFSIALTMMSFRRSGSPGRIARGDGGCWCRIAAAVIMVVAAAKAARPVAISYSTRPSENESERASSSSPRTCSGDM